MIPLLRRRHRHTDPATSADDQTTTQDAPGGDDAVDESCEQPSEANTQPARSRPKDHRVTRIAVFIALPVLALTIVAGTGYLKWQATSMRAAQTSATDSVKAASDTVTKMLSYRPDTVDHDLASASDLLTGDFRNDYTTLTHDVVIPGAKEKQISAVATVPAASSISATGDHAVVLVFVNQTVIIGSSPPSNTASSVRVTLQKHDDHWLVSSFEPI
jgi:Mce-associated membrane protein